MKPKPTLDPTAAFPDPQQTPADDQLKPVLGPAFPPLNAVLAAVTQLCPDATVAWQFSKQAGWYRVALRKKRRLFYLVPKRGDFRLSLILGGKAIASLKDSPQSRAVVRLIETAKRYPEGTAFEFNAASCDTALITAMLAAKIAH
jgi:hypothetical protein